MNILLSAAEWIITKTSPDTVFYDNKNFPWVDELEEAYPQIKAELITLLQSGPVPDFTKLSEEQRFIAPEGQWRTFIFCVYCKYIEHNCDQCPGTAAAIKKIPRVTAAMFSILKPHTHLAPHRGPYKGVLRCHLGLIIPKESCAIRVKDEIRPWTEGKVMIFDDSFDHEAWNWSYDLRVVLFIDFERPLPVWVAPMNRFMIWLIGASPFIQKILANIEAERKNG